MGVRFNAPPGWPEPPRRWAPEPGWQPDPSWPPPPPGWQFYKHSGPARGVIRIGSIAVVAVVGLGFAYAQAQGESDRAPKVGECAKRVSAQKIERVSCNDPEALYRVTSRHEGTSDIRSACRNDPQARVGYAFHETSHGMTAGSFVLCLAMH